MELQKYIDLPINAETIESFSYLHRIFGKNNVMLNQIYFKNGLPVNVDYARFIKPICTSIRTDFDASFAPKTNAIISELTHGLITNIVDRPSPDTMMVLLNIIYFKEQWLHSFNKRTSKMGVFRSDVQRNEMMMHLDSTDLMYYEDHTKQVVELPYKNRLFKMGFILPKSTISTNEIFEVLNSNNLQEASVIVTIPKFKSRVRLDLKNAFEQLGLKSMFNESANFGKMLTDPKNYYISKVLHEAVINVDEEGTEASAVTLMNVSFNCAPSISRKIYFTADHPFVYYIKFKGYTLFLGYYK
jgi:serine protease inhibitor